MYIVAFYISKNCDSTFMLIDGNKLTPLADADFAGAVVYDNRDQAEDAWTRTKLWAAIDPRMHFRRVNADGTVLHEELDVYWDVRDVMRDIGYMACTLEKFFAKSGKGYFFDIKGISDEEGVFFTSAAGALTWLSDYAQAHPEETSTMTIQCCSALCSFDGDGSGPDFSEGGYNHDYDTVVLIDGGKAIIKEKEAM